MVLASSLLHKSSMTKKRVKLGLAILGGLTAFLLGLIALVFVPTGASAGKGPVFGQEQDGGGSAGHSNLAYFEPPSAGGTNNAPQHSDEGVSPCIGVLCDTDGNDAPGQDIWRYAGSQGDEGGGGQGNGHAPGTDSGDQGRNGNGNPWLFAGGYPGGGYPGGGAPQDQSGACSSKKDKGQDSKSKTPGEKTCDSDHNNDGNNSSNNAGNGAGYEQLIVQNDKGASGDSSDGSDDTSGDPSNNLADNDPPPGGGSDGDLPPVDPNCFPFAASCDTHGGNPPDTVLTDPPSEVPEPLTLSLFAAGLTGVAVLRRRSRQKTVAQPD